MFARRSNGHFGILEIKLVAEEDRRISLQPEF